MGVTTRGVPYTDLAEPADILIATQELAEWINDNPGVPEVTTAQRNAFTNDTRPPLIANLTTARPEFWDGSTWRQLAYKTEVDAKASTAHTHAYQPTSEKGQVNGYAPLGSDGLVPQQHLGDAGLTGPVGVIAMWPGAAAPAGWFICDGSLKSKTTYPDLFAAVGNNYGTGDASNFRLPDLRSRFIRGKGTSDPLGGTGGADTHAHTASGSTSSGGAHSHDVEHQGSGGPHNVIELGNDRFEATSDGAHTHTLSGVTVAASDGRPPFVNLNVIIKHDE